jgi:hypothetical protein
MEGRDMAHGDALDAGCLCVLLGGLGVVGGGDWMLGRSGCLVRRAGPVVGVPVCSEHGSRLTRVRAAQSVGDEEPRQRPLSSPLNSSHGTGHMTWHASAARRVSRRV